MIVMIVIVKIKNAKKPVYDWRPCFYLFIKIKINYNVRTRNAWTCTRTRERSRGNPCAGVARVSRPRGVCSLVCGRRRSCKCVNPLALLY